MQATGNKLLASGDFLGAIKEYTNAIDIVLFDLANDSSRADSTETLSILYSNRYVLDLTIACEKISKIKKLDQF